MDTLAKSEIFFIVTTVAVVIITLVISVAALYILKILRDIKFVVNLIKNEAGNVTEDIADLRTHFKSQGLTLMGLLGVGKKIFDRRRKKK
jgi:hypothetical protein